eukprot:1293923-Amphidinium_carterae.1
MVIALGNLLFAAGSYMTMSACDWLGAADLSNLGPSGPGGKSNSACLAVHLRDVNLGEQVAAGVFELALHQQLLPVSSAFPSKPGHVLVLPFGCASSERAASEALKRQSGRNRRLQAAGRSGSGPCTRSRTANEHVKCSSLLFIASKHSGKRCGRGGWLVLLRWLHGGARNLQVIAAVCGGAGRGVACSKRWKLSLAGLVEVQQVGRI